MRHLAVSNLLRHKASRAVTVEKGAPPHRLRRTPSRRPRVRRRRLHSASRPHRRRLDLARGTPPQLGPTRTGSFTAAQPTPPDCAMSPNLYWLPLAVCLTFASAAPEPGRAPKVYNALITSSQNLAPSKSFPFYQPVYQDPYGLPFSPSFYDAYNFKSLFGEPSLQPRAGPDGPPQESSSGPSAPSVPTPYESAPPGEDRPRDEEEAAPSAPQPADSDKPQQTSPPPQPATESPIPLNEFGLPPAILPLGPNRPGEPPTAFSYDPFARFSPYYPQYPQYPQYDPYLDPYAFQSYPLLPQVYRFGGAPQPPQQPQPAPAEAPPSPAPTVAPETAPSATKTPPAPSDLDVKNYSNKDPSIPDVPPPPIPTGGLKDNIPKTN